jgi:hypothetical protein
MRDNISRKNLHHAKPLIHLNPNKPSHGAQEKQMVFGYRPPPQTAQETFPASRSTPLVAKLALVGILESKVCQEKTTTFEGAQLSQTL